LRLAITSNGPGEFAGWVRPLLRELYARDPGLEATLLFVPDDYATGREADVARALFPQAHVLGPREYVRFALGANVAGAPQSADLVLYLGGDLMHAARAHKRLGGKAAAYKFSRKRYRALFDKVYAVDAGNVRQLATWGVPPERIAVVGNLAIDGAFDEAQGAFSSSPPDETAVDGGVLIMPGTRRREVENLVPFYLQVAVWLRRLWPSLPVAFGISPFTTDAELTAVLARGGDPRFWGTRGTLENGALVAEGSRERFPVVREAMRYAPRARAVLTIPGTKCIELAALGVATIVCTPLNAPEMIVVNGPLTYLDRIPLAGVPLKRVVVATLGSRFPMLAQPNIDAGEMLMPELRGALMPARVARVTAEYVAGDHSADAARLARLYAGHRGAAERMARSLLELR
jgi:lipid-A-disaccharide synthase